MQDVLVKVNFMSQYLTYRISEEKSERYLGTTSSPGKGLARFGCTQASRRMLHGSMTWCCLCLENMI